MTEMLTPSISPAFMTTRARITPLNTLSAADLIASLRAASGSLGVSYDTRARMLQVIFAKLETETIGLAEGNGQAGIAPEIKRYVKGIYRTEREIAQEIDGLVREQVAECLKTLIPQDLQDEVAAQKTELGELRIKLHNSESRRANASLRSNQPDETLHDILMSNGAVSKHFPKSLKELFEIDGQ
ncbi:hypothetical protein H0H81_006331 [Sphagnurus paluster]|uniref:Uncharacterized protein n=1 Tax=Sphagnurus paluster TaxID=117069 RepID=A0A9P7FTD9_9AGAR|nr:hypothetical protein H0H81_006331 [Sphagnurus paluster]